MKHLRISILFSLASMIGIAGYSNNDDFSSEKKTLPEKISLTSADIIITETKAACPKKKWDHYMLYPDGYYTLPQEAGCYCGDLNEVENFKVRIMPNPVSEIINIIYDIDCKGRVTIELLTSKGNLVRTLFDETAPAGHGVHSFNIDGKVCPGIAYIRFKAGNIVKVELVSIL